MSASSSIEMRGKEKTMQVKRPPKRAARSGWRLGTAASVMLAAAALSACQTTEPVGPVAEAVVPVTPTDLRLRHPIKLREGTRAVELFIGSHRTDLTPTQRAQVAYFGQNWNHYATGGVAIRVPTATPNAEAARRSVNEIRSILVASGVPAGGIVVTDLPPFPPNQLVPIVLEYPKIVASAGPCGRWPHDLGPGDGLDYMTNEPYYNFGCAQQHNLAAMLDEPADMVEPRAETPPYTARRDQVFDKYKKGESTATIYPDLDKAKISEIGK
jgi:pilus assembly protein CpaD